MTSKEAMEAIKKSLDLIQMKFGILLYKDEWVEAIEQDLEVLEILKNILDNNVLYRVFPYKMVHEFEKFLKSDKALKEWLEKWQDTRKK